MCLPGKQLFGGGDTSKLRLRFGKRLTQIRQRRTRVSFDGRRYFFNVHFFKLVSRRKASRQLCKVVDLHHAVRKLRNHL